MTAKTTTEKTAGKSFPMRFIDFFFVACLLFAVFIGSIAFTGMKANQLLKWKELELQEARQMQREMERQYREALAELEILRAEYEEMQALRERQKAEIQRTLVNRRSP